VDIRANQPPSVWRPWPGIRNSQSEDSMANEIDTKLLETIRQMADWLLIDEL
jgi:hypothetical protein